MRQAFILRILRASALVCLFAPVLVWAGVTDALWQDQGVRNLSSDAPQPASYRVLALDGPQMKSHLKKAFESGAAVDVSLPLPEGGFAEFSVIDSGTLPVELQKKYPDILSFKGLDEEGRRLRLDVSSLGFQAMVFDPEGIWVVRPETINTGTNQHLSYRRAELAMSDTHWQCETHGDVPDLDKALRGPAQPKTITGTSQRVYRAAIAANNKYIAAVGGGTVAGGLAATTSAVNRVNELYEHEMSIRFQLVPNNDLIMYANAGSDPFNNQDDIWVINNATSIINGVIGSSNYDVGHVFSTSGGGVAGLRVVCGSSKARGTTGLPNPVGDDFYIDYVAHEMGHQFGGNHPFNGQLGNCTGGNRNGSTAYEPGSGSTIMSYAGICSGDNLQDHSDPYFHAISLQEITNFTNAGGNCSMNTPNPNQPPVIDTLSLPTGMTIPVQTPFVLTAAADDPNPGDTLGYSWEQWDLGPQAPLSAGDNGSSPLFRTWRPKPTGERVFPSMSTVLGGPALEGETLPTKTRSSMKFRLTVRDRSDDLLGSGTSQSADIAFAVTNAAGPFKVTSPATGLNWAGGSIESIAWDVAGTAAAPVLCHSVDIRLSTDGGQTFPHNLATGVPNSGSAGVAVPNVPTNQARVRVDCSNNVFFNVSPGNFTIVPAGTLFTVGGNVSGLVGSGLRLQLNSGNDLAISSDGPFTFSGGLVDGTHYVVSVGTQPDTPRQVCTIDNGSGTINEADVGDVLITCTHVQSYTVGGTLNGLTGAGLTLRLNGGASYLVSGNDFTFPDSLYDGEAYTVTIDSQPYGQTCSVANGSGTIHAANVTDVAVHCVDKPPQAYSVGGRVRGLMAPGLILQLNAGLTLTLNANGKYSFYPGVSTGNTYEVTVLGSPAGQRCVVSNASGTMGHEDVSDVDVDCAALGDDIFSDGFES